MHPAVENGWLLVACAPKHDDTYPIELSEADLLGKYKLVAGTREEFNAGRALRMGEPTDTIFKWVGDYRICAGRYSIHPKAQAKEVKRSGNLVLTTLHGHIVAATQQHFIWVHPEHQGHRLSVEMVIASLVYWGVDSHMNSGPGHDEYMLTRDGVRLRKLQHRLMVKRGIVVEPPSSPKRVPTPAPPSKSAPIPAPPLKSAPVPAPPQKRRQPSFERWLAKIEERRRQ